MDFRILGPLEVVEDDEPVVLGGGRERALLAMLLLRANEVVPTHRLVEQLWGEDPPASAAKALQVYVSRLRKRLGADVLRTRGGGYEIVVAEDRLDLVRFERLVADARRNGPLEAASTLRDALSLWRGSPLAEFSAEPFARSEIARLEELRLAAVEDRIDADLALGRHAELVAELELLVSRNPYRERLRRQLMLALYRSGRQAEALAAYKGARRALADELGLEPGPELKALERQILAHDAALMAPTASTHSVVHDASEITSRSRRRRRAIALAVLSALLIGATAVAAVAFSGGSAPELIVATPSSVALIDPGTNRVVAAIHVADRPTQIGVDRDSVWVLHPDIRTVSRLDRSTWEVLRTAGVGGAPSGLAVGGEGPWISDAHSGEVTLLDREALTVARTVKTRSHPIVGPDTDAGQLALGFGSLWFASGESTITRIDPETGRVLARIRGVDTGESLGGIAVGDDSIWVAGPYQESLVTRIDPATNTVTATILVSKFRLNGIAVGGTAVYVSDIGSDQVWVIDAVRNEATRSTRVGGQPLGVAFGAGSIWVANSGDGTVARLDPASGRVLETIRVGGSPNGIAAADDGVWVTVD